MSSNSFYGNHSNDLAVGFELQRGFGRARLDFEALTMVGSEAGLTPARYVCRPRGHLNPALAARRLRGAVTGRLVKRPLGCADSALRYR
jgi:hypothetical protein